MKSDADIEDLLRESAGRVALEEPPMERILRRGRRRAVHRVTAVACSVAVVTAGLGLGLVSLSRVGRRGDSAQLPLPRPTKAFSAIERVDVFGRPIRRPVAAYGAFWSIVQEGGGGDLVVVRVDARTLQSTVIAGLSYPQALAAGHGSIWVLTSCSSEGPNDPTCQDNRVVQLDPAGAVQAEFYAFGGRYPISAGENGVWVGARSGDDVATLTRLNLNCVNCNVPLVDVGSFLPKSSRCCVQDIANVGGLIWVMVGEHLVRVDPGTAKATDTGVRGDLMTADEHGVWVNTARLGPAAIVRVDPTTGEQVASIDGPGFGYPSAGGGFVWLAVTPQTGPDADSIVVYRIDPATDSIERARSVPAGSFKGGRIGIGGPVQQVAWDDGVLWVTDENAFQVIRIDLGP
jgi:hypothetical protein